MSNETDEDSVSSGPVYGAVERILVKSLSQCGGFVTSSVHYGVKASDNYQDLLTVIEKREGVEPGMVCAYLHKNGREMRDMSVGVLHSIESWWRYNTGYEEPGIFITVGFSLLYDPAPSINFLRVPQFTMDIYDGWGGPWAA